jgi:hypothetical protein
VRAGTSAGSIGSVLALVLVSIGSAAHAQPRPASPASNAAGALFNKGRQYLAAGKYAEAGAAFERSQQLDPQLGTLFNLATCHAHLGKLATAWGEFHDIAQRDPNRTRRAAAAREADRLAPRLPRLVIKLDPPVADATVTSNGVDVGALLGVESPVDLGDYAIAARAPGYAEAQSHAKITDEGKTVVVAIALARPVIEAPPPAPAPVAPPVAEPPAPPVSGAPSPATPLAGRGRRPGRAIARCSPAASCSASSRATAGTQPDPCADRASTARPPTTWRARRRTPTRPGCAAISPPR